MSTSTGKDLLAGAHAQWHDNSGNLIYETCEWARCDFWEIGTFLLAELAGDETRHKVKFHADDFTIEHPLIERLDGSLMDCEYHAMVTAQAGPPSPLGLYWLERNGWDGSPAIELIEATEGDGN